MKSDPLLSQKLDKLTQKGVKNFYRYEAQFIDDQGRFLSVHNVSMLKIEAKYYEKYTADLFVSVQVYKSIYQKILQANRNKLRLRLTTIPNSTTGKSESVGKRIVNTYDAFLTDPKSDTIQNKQGELTGSRTDDMSEILEITVHLIEGGLREFRSTIISGVYKNVTVQKLLEGLLSVPLKTIDPSGKTGYAVTVYPPDNTSIQYQVMIPNSIKLTDVPDYLQNSLIGVYSTDIGYFLQNKMWFIWPAFQLDRYNKSLKKLNIILIPSNEMGFNDSTLVIEGNNYTVYATGETEHIDSADKDMFKSGHGFKSAKEGNVVDHFSTVKNGKVEIPKGRNKLNVNLDQRDSPISDTPMVDGGGTSSNPYKDASKVSSKIGTTLKVNWNSSDHSILRPGMSVKVTYKTRGKTYTVLGVLKGHDTTISTRQNSPLDNRYVSQTVLTLHVEQPKDKMPS